MRKLLVCVTALSLSSCGGNAVSNTIGAGGGELCLNDRRVCINVPLNGLADDKVLYIRPSAENPGGQLSDVWEIGPNGTLFLKEATVTFKYDMYLDGGLDQLDPTLVRIYTRELLDGGGYGDWQALNESQVDRVRLEVIGTTPHLSAFCLMRTDHLSDGGIPMEGDAGPVKDAGMIICPPPCMAAGNCTDMKLNNGETDVDCGGANMCPRCGLTHSCVANSDCESMRCAGTTGSKTCRPPIPDGGAGGGGGGAGGGTGGSGGGTGGGGGSGGGNGGGTSGGNGGGTAGGAAGGTAGGAAGGTAGGAAGGTAGGAAGGTAGGAAGGTAGGTAGGAAGGTAGGAAGGAAGGTAGGAAGGTAGGTAGGAGGGVDDGGMDAGCIDAGDGGCQ